MTMHMDVGPERFLGEEVTKDSACKKKRLCKNGALNNVVKHFGKVFSDLSR